MATHAAVEVDARETSFQEFLEAYDGVHAEWVDGRVYLVSPGNRRQSLLTRFLSSVLQYWADTHDGGETFLGPYGVRLDERQFRSPDVFFVRPEHLGRAKDAFVDGAPDLAIEIATASSRAVDRGEKFYAYEEAGVAEHWFLDPERKQIEAYRPDDRGTYMRCDLGDPPVLRSEVLRGMWIPVAWLWANPLPRLPEVYREWGLSS